MLELIWAPLLGALSLLFDEYSDPRCGRAHTTPCARAWEESEGRRGVRKLAKSLTTGTAHQLVCHAGPAHPASQAGVHLPVGLCRGGVPGHVPGGHRAARRVCDEPVQLHGAAQPQQHEGQERAGLQGAAARRRQRGRRAGGQVRTPGRGGGRAGSMVKAVQGGATTFLASQTLGWQHIPRPTSLQASHVACGGFVHILQVAGRAALRQPLGAAAADGERHADRRRAVCRARRRRGGVDEASARDFNSPMFSSSNYCLTAQL